MPERKAAASAAWDADGERGTSGSCRVRDVWGGGEGTLASEV